eukprot:CAMPEP_0172477960 /NCGR_PEP_ID=MMETSP1066-20121228/1580_1 /TAXON_ID=671091 /ORGANISM="Coscinodiscus wailesii, Strain CCMP2513" /LENGTH=73 /DNA_ID=CAMNT_0013237047 /DNA_START=72 /DNA_END=290 /DNA_ORIENTATION=+
MTIHIIIRSPRQLLGNIPPLMAMMLMKRNQYCLLIIRPLHPSSNPDPSDSRTSPDTASLDVAEDATQSWPVSV